MDFRQHTAVFASVAAIAGGCLLTGCAGGDHDHAAIGSRRPVTSSSTALDEGRAKPDTLPAGFPAGVPVVKGDIASKHDDYSDHNGGEIWILTVTGIDAAAYDTAERLLVAAKFTHGNADASDGTCERRSAFNNINMGGRDMVTLCGNISGSRYQLEYSVFVVPRGTGPGTPEIPAPPIPPRFPGG